MKTLEQHLLKRNLKRQHAVLWDKQKWPSGRAVVHRQALKGAAWGVAPIEPASQQVIIATTNINDVAGKRSPVQ